MNTIGHGTTLLTAGDAWIDTRASLRKLGERSVRIYRQHYQSLANYAGDKPVGEYGRADAEGWQRHSLAGLTGTTHYSRLSAVVVLFDWLVSVDAIETNVFRKLERPSRDARSQRRPAEVPVVRRLHDIAQPRERLMIELASVLGLRRFEIAKLKRSDFATSTGMLYVVGKGNKQATIAMPPWLVESVLAYCAEADIGPTGYLFPGRQKGQPMTAGQVGRAITELSHRIGEHVTPHQYRHMAGTEANRAGGLKMAQALLRHSSSSTTDTYVHSDAEEVRTTTTALGEVIFGPRDAA